MQILVNDRDYLDDFVRLNEEWIAKYFQIEEVDIKIAKNPGQIIDTGGYIFTLIDGNQVVGVCALFKQDDSTFEIARMAVPPEHQGNGFGDQLMEACIAKLDELGVRRTIVYSNTKLKAAVSLYKKYGFRTLKLGQHAAYSRANIVLERKLS